MQTTDRWDEKVNRVFEEQRFHLSIYAFYYGRTKARAAS